MYGEKRSGTNSSKALADLAEGIGRAGLIIDSVAMAAAVRLTQLPPAEAKRKLQAILDGPTTVLHSNGSISLLLGKSTVPFVSVPDPSHARHSKRGNEPWRL